MLIQIVGVVLNRFENSDLDEFFEGKRVLLLGLQLDVGLLCHDKVVLRKLLLVAI